MSTHEYLDQWLPNFVERMVKNKGTMEAIIQEKQKELMSKIYQEGFREGYEQGCNDRKSFIEEITT